MLCMASVAGPQERRLRSYVDEGSGIVLAYPSEYKVRKNGAGSDFRIGGRDGVTLLKGQVEELAAYPGEMYRHSRDVFRDFAVHRAMLRCCADGPDGSAYCNSVYSIIHFENPKGLRVIKLMLDHVQIVYADPPETTQTVVGPVYAVDISRPDYVAFVLIGSAPYEALSEAKIALAESLVDGLNLLPDTRFRPRRLGAGSGSESGADPGADPGG
jgi:hypothetical protein